MSDDYSIVVLQQGWVLVGRVQDYETDHCPLVLQPSAVLRRWGTENGLGELHDGPRANTVLDPIPGEVRIRPGCLLYTVRVDSEAWARVFEAKPVRAAKRAGGAR